MGTLVGKRLLSKMDTMIRVQIFGKAVYIFHNATTLGKCMNPAIPPLVMSR